MGWETPRRLRAVIGVGPRVPDEHHDQLHPPRISTRYGNASNSFCLSFLGEGGLSTLALEGKVRLQKWFTTMSLKVKAKIVKDVTQLVLARRTKMCNFLEYKGT